MKESLVTLYGEQREGDEKDGSEQKIWEQKRRMEKYVPESPEHQKRTLNKISN